MTTQLTHRKGSLSEAQKRKGISFAQAFLTVEAVIVVDISGSMSTSDVPSEAGLVSRHSEANRQLARLQRRFPGRLAVVAFSDNAEFCPDGQLPPTRGGTNMYGALEFIAPADGCGIKIIVASDGCPDDPASTLNYAKKMTTPIDSIYIGNEDHGRRFMEELARATKGRSIDESVLELEESVIKLLGDGK